MWKQTMWALLSHTHCTYIVEEGGESIAIDLEVAVKWALQQMCHMFKPTTRERDRDGERERDRHREREIEGAWERRGWRRLQFELFSLSLTGDKKITLPGASSRSSNQQLTLMDGWIYMPVYPSICVQTYQPTNLPTYPFTNQLTSLSTNKPLYLPNYPFTNQHTSLSPN